MSQLLLCGPCTQPSSPRSLGLYRHVCFDSSVVSLYLTYIHRFGNTCPLYFALWLLWIGIIHFSDTRCPMTSWAAQGLSWARPVRPCASRRVAMDANYCSGLGVDCGSAVSWTLIVFVVFMAASTRLGSMFALTTTPLTSSIDDNNMRRIPWLPLCVGRAAQMSMMNR